MTGKANERDVAVVGGGLAGLTAGVLLAREGRRVVVLERSGAPGGRARTRVEEGYHLNLGPHALYLAGTGARVLRELGVWPEGGRPDPAGAWGLREGRLSRLPRDASSTLTSKLLGPLDKLSLAWAVMRATRVDPTKLAGEDGEAWLRRICPTVGSRGVLEALVRLASYAHDGGQGADAVAAKLQDVLEGVLYPHEGWQTLVDALVDALEEAGGELRTSAPVEALLMEDREIRGVRLADRSIAARVVLLALPVKAAAALVMDHLPGMEVTLRKALPARVATLDLGLARLPEPHRTFVLGIDRPLYFSAHSAVARLAPEGRALVHATRYLGPGERPEPASLESELEEFLTLVQPGWRELVETRQFLPDITVTSTTVRGSEGGLPSRQDVAAADVRGLFLAGDWVGPEGLLSDAAVTSAAAAAALACRFLDGDRVGGRRRIADYVEG